MREEPPNMQNGEGERMVYLPDENTVESILQMGFERNAVERALRRANGDQEHAIDILVSDKNTE